MDTFRGTCIISQQHWILTLSHQNRNILFGIKIPGPNLVAWLSKGEDEGKKWARSNLKVFAKPAVN